MSGDWIKMRASLCTNPHVVMIAEIIGESTEIGRRLSTGFNGCLDELVIRDVTRDVTIASLFRVWCAANEHTHDGVWCNSSLSVIDAASGVPGFGAAMEAAGWAIFDPEKMTVTLPNFNENNAPSKGGARSTGAERQARYRKKKASLRDVTSNVTSDVTSDAREEKRREESNTPPTPSKGVTDPPGFVEFWTAWPASNRKVDRKKCAAKWRRCGFGDQLPAILANIEMLKHSQQWRDGYEPAPLTYLNGERWLDEAAAERTPGWLAETH